MKRPEGFDLPTEAEKPPKTGRLRMPAPPTSKTSAAAPESSSAAPKSDPRDSAAPTSVPPGTETTSTGEPSDRAARRELRRAARARRRYEHSEVRRFTRRSRRRRVVWSVVAGIAVTTGTLVAVAVYSPLLALTTIEVDGAVRIDPAAIRDAVDGQLGTPLALLDFDRVTEELGDFPLIRSYVTELIPPGTLVINVVEREAIGAVADGSEFILVDPAGVVIERSAARPPGAPLIDTAGAESGSAAFDAAVEVMLALPDSVRAGLDTVTASTRDDVRLTLAGGGAQIIWGSADDSAYKARVLAAALAQNYPDVSQYNVSAPGQLTYR